MGARGAARDVLGGRRRVRRPADVAPCDVVRLMMPGRALMAACLSASGSGDVCANRWNHASGSTAEVGAASKHSEKIIASLL